MRMRVVTLCIVILVSGTELYAQNTQAALPIQHGDPMVTISYDIRKISEAVQMLSLRMKEFVDKFEKVGGVTINEKQQKLIMGLEILVRSEQRLATLQKFQIDLVEKQGISRA